MDTMTDNLPEKLHDATEKARLRYLVLATIDGTLVRGKIDAVKAREWLQGEGLLSELEA
jgi:hypothetical protein